jgi:uncharacterized protein (DUF433 family)
MSDAEPIIRPNANGTPAIRGSRINIFHVMDYYLANRAPEWVAREALPVPPEDVVAAYDYIRVHEAELRPEYDAIMAWQREQMRQQASSPELQAKFAASHEKLMRLKADLDRKRQAEGGNADQGARAAG